MPYYDRSKRLPLIHYRILITFLPNLAENISKAWDH